MSTTERKREYRKRTVVGCSFHLDVNQGIVSTGNGGCISGTTTSRDNKQWIGVERNTTTTKRSRGTVTLKLLTSGTGATPVCWCRPAYGSMMYPNVGDYEGRTGLSPPAAYPCDPWGTQQTPVTASLNTTFILVVTTLNRDRQLRAIKI